MKLFSLFQNLRKNKTHTPVFYLAPNFEGLELMIREDARDKLDVLSQSDPLCAMQLILLRMLEEQGLAEKRPTGYFLTTAAVLDQDEDFRTLFNFPPFFDGRFKLDVSGLTSQSNFKVQLKVFQQYELIGAHLAGPFLQVGNTLYSLTKPQWKVMQAVEAFNSKSEHSTFDNNQLIHSLKCAQQQDQQARIQSEKVNLEKSSIDPALTPPSISNQFMTNAQPLAQGDNYQPESVAATFNTNYVEPVASQAGQVGFGQALNQGLESQLGLDAQIGMGTQHGLGQAFGQEIDQTFVQELNQSLSSQYGLAGLAAQKRAQQKANAELAALPPLKIDLRHFDNLHTSSPDKVRIAAESDAAGNLVISPVFGNSAPIEIAKRLSHVPQDNQAGVMHINDEIVLFKPEISHAIHQVLQQHVIAKEHVQDFLQSPTAFIQDANIDFDSGFSLRVKGAEVFCHKYFGDTESSHTKWFDELDGELLPLTAVIKEIKSEEDLIELYKLIQDAKSVGAAAITFNGEVYNINCAVPVAKVFELIQQNLHIAESPADNFNNQDDEGYNIVLKIEDNDEEVNFSTYSPQNHEELEHPQTSKTTDFSCDNLLRTPFDYQAKGIAWILSNFEQGKLSPSHTGGGLLADDMGLGKTFMTLVAIEEIQKRYERLNQDKKPVLVVAPLSLIENWENEVRATFKHNPFEDIVVLQAARDLSYFRTNSSFHETKQYIGQDTTLDQLKYALKVGAQYAPEQLDRAGRLVLTTYDTLREFQFSLSRIDWSMVAFDEAQVIKNPNALVTRAAKALKADFKLLITGTPVENSLKDIWCLMDTALPGLLGSWQDFRETYITPINKATNQAKRQHSTEQFTAKQGELTNIKLQVGRKLREVIGFKMLRRCKEDELSGLPKKVVFTPVCAGNSQDLLDSSQTTVDLQTSATSSGLVLMSKLGQVMAGAQLNHYNDWIQSVTKADSKTRIKLFLPALQHIKIASIHHALDNQDLNICDVKAEESCKIMVLDYILDQVKARNEKAIVFAISKRVQCFLSLYLQSKYKIPVNIVNGDTQAVTSTSGAFSRKQILDYFQSQLGFGVIILSPIAVGVGLTITGANNVIHMERHWNPAKEAQATDRVYRIGQKRQVNVYLPMALHPQTESFDEKINLLLHKKVDLSSAVVTNDDITCQDFDDLFMQ